MENKGSRPDSYQALLVLPPQSEQNQSVVAGDQQVSGEGATRHSDGTLRQGDLNDLHLHSAPHRRAAQQVAEQTHPDAGLLLRLRGASKMYSYLMVLRYKVNGTKFRGSVLPGGAN